MSQELDADANGLHLVRFNENNDAIILFHSPSDPGDAPVSPIGLRNLVGFLSMPAKYTALTTVAALREVALKSSASGWFVGVARPAPLVAFDGALLRAVLDRYGLEGAPTPDRQVRLDLFQLELDLFAGGPVTHPGSWTALRIVFAPLAVAIVAPLGYRLPPPCTSTLGGWQPGEPEHPTVTAAIAALRAEHGVDLFGR